MNEQHIWERMENEPNLWYSRFVAYLQMGPSRSLLGAVHAEEKAEKSREKQSAKVPGSWVEASKQWNWKLRAEAYDTHWLAEQDKIIAQEKERVLRSGFALQHKRIEQLNALADKLIAMTADEDKVWVPDVKSIGTGPTARQVDIVNFNYHLFKLINEYMASIAAEKGERAKKNELTGRDGGPIEFFTEWGGGVLGDQREEDR